MSQEISTTVNYAKLAGDVKSQVVNLSAMLLDVPPEHAAHASLAEARKALEAAYGKLKASIETLKQNHKSGYR